MDHSFALYAAFSGETLRYDSHTIVGFSTLTRTGMTGMQRRFVNNIYILRR